MSRSIEQVIEGNEGGFNGVRIVGSIGGKELRNFDPFLLLDLGIMPPESGFPDHPHRGFETVSYILHGQNSHEDFLGNKGVLNAGDVMWMTAGRGIMHSELPSGDEVMTGFQLWVNLSKENKMIPPHHQILRSEVLPVVSKDGVTVKVIAGESMGAKSPAYTRTPVHYFDFKLDTNASFTQPLPSEWNAFAFIVKGEGVFGSNNVKGSLYNTLVFSKGDSISFKNNSNEQLHFILLAGQPLNEPIARGGSYVMNYDQEIQQAREDFALAQNGFENAKTWQSEGSKQKFGSH